jgi:hypothetical protein
LFARDDYDAWASREMDSVPTSPICVRPVDVVGHPEGEAETVIIFDADCRNEAVQGDRGPGADPDLAGGGTFVIEPDGTVWFERQIVEATDQDSRDEDALAGTCQEASALLRTAAPSN